MMEISALSSDLVKHMLPRCKRFETLWLFLKYETKTLNILSETYVNVDYAQVIVAVPVTI